MSGDWYSNAFGISIAVVIIGGPLLFHYYRLRKEHAFMQRMAAVLQLGYTEKGSNADIASHMLKAEGGQIYDLIAGVYHTVPLQAFTYSVYIRSGKSGHWSYMTVFEVDSPVILPEIVVQPELTINFNGASQQGFTNMEFGTLLGSYDSVQLEGDFNKYFKLYAAKGAQMETREILQPDTMAFLIDKYRSFGFEFTQNKFYLYPMKLIKNEQEFLDALALVEHFYSKLKPTLDEMHSTSQ